MKNSVEIETALARLYRAESGKILAVLIAQFRDFDLAEDTFQDAVTQAVVVWRRDGLPRNACAWLLTVARRQAINRLRRTATHAKAEPLLSVFENTEVSTEVSDDEDAHIPDERLKLIFTCCHPAINEEAQVALTLKTVCGLSVHQIARAFLISETTLQQRLVRAKKKLRLTGIPYLVPSGKKLADRLDTVLDVVYLIFNEGFSRVGASESQPDLCHEALGLGRTLYHLLPTPEVCGLLALVLLHNARRPARLDQTGDLIPLEHQDRSKWDAAQIAEGKQLLKQCLSQQSVGRYQIQAAISALHADVAGARATDWSQIELLYRLLEHVMPSPIVTLNRAVALSYADTAVAGLTLLESIGTQLEQYQPYHAARADLLRRAGRLEEALTAYEAALALTENHAERQFLQQRAEECRRRNVEQR